ncbi:MAG TPA: flagellar hook capping FlgD N-terminal domain-containing protein [Anaeromyxobacter sp.]|nr:flagellar hook capping FlgD N-terminal domain-containing protein [Anaeromyxobacter sp.]
MATTSPVSSLISSLPATDSSSTTQSSSSTDDLGEDAFLKLLTTEMQNQDPLQPVDNTQMLAQLAQFSQLSEIQKLSSKIDNMVTATNSASELTATQLVGKQVSFQATQLGLIAGSPSTFGISMPQATADATAVISDSNGKVVRTLHLGAEPAGASAVSWDGLDDSGRACATGQYYLSVAGTTSAGATVTGSANIRATVTGIDLSSGTAQLIVAGQEIPISSVNAVYDNSQSM